MDYNTLILAVAGGAIKWARGFPWFNDFETVVVCAVAATAMTVANGHAADAQSFFQAFGTDIQTVLAALGAGHLLAKSTNGMVMPRNNQFGPPTAPSVDK